MIANYSLVIPNWSCGTQQVELESAREKKKNIEIIQTRMTRWKTLIPGFISISCKHIMKHLLSLACSSSSSSGISSSSSLFSVFWQCQKRTNQSTHIH